MPIVTENNIGQALKIENDPKFSANIISAINKYLYIRDGELANNSSRFERISDHSLLKIDSREFTTLPWMMADNQNNLQNDAKFKEAADFAFGYREYREKIMDSFYDAKKETDYRTFDFSAVMGKDNEQRSAEGELTKSEKDVVRFLSHVATITTESEFKKKNPDFYNDRMRLLSAQEQFVTQLNSEYLTTISDAAETLLKKKNGYKNSWANDENEIAEFNRGKNDITNVFAYYGENIGIAHQIYSYRMAMVKGENNPPQPTIKFTVPERWDGLSIREFGENLKNTRDTDTISVNGQDKNWDACEHMYNTIFNHLRYPMGKTGNDPADELKEFDNIYIDDVPATEYIGNKNVAGPPGNKVSVYRAIVLSALLSGEHRVETGVRYMKSDGTMDMKILTVEPDLTAVADAEIKRHSWIRRLFNWGPFKIDNCKRRQARRIANETQELIDQRHEGFLQRNDMCQKTRSNPKQIIFPECEDNRILENVRVAYKPMYHEWIHSIQYNLRTNVKAGTFVRRIKDLNEGKRQNWDITKSLKASIENIGVGNTLRIFGRQGLNLDGNEFGSSYDRALKSYDKIPADYNPSISNKDTFNNLMNYLFKHGGLENEYSQIIISSADLLAESQEQKNFINSLKIMNKDKDEYERELEKLVNDNDRTRILTDKEADIIKKYETQSYLNKMLCDKISDKLSAEKSFDDSILNSKEAKILNASISNVKQYDSLVESIIKNEAKDGKKCNISETLSRIHENINKVPKEIKGAISHVIEEKQNVVEVNNVVENQAAKQVNNNAGEQKPIQAQIVN